MNDIENVAQEFAAMYDSLFFSFFGTSGISTNSAEINRECPIPMYFKNNLNKCPAKALVVNVLAKVQSPQPEELPEVKKKVRSYLSRSKLIDFEKLDDIYTTVRDQQLHTQHVEQRLDTQHISQYKDKILDIIDPQYLVALHLYMKYHRVFITELFDAFYHMINTADMCDSNSDISYYCFAALTIGEEIVKAVRECIYGTNGKVTKKPEKLYQEVYSDFFTVVNQFPSFEAYKPQMKTFEVAIEEVLDYAKDNWKPKASKRNKDGEFFPATVKQYLDILTQRIRKKVIIKLGTKTGQGKNDDTNLRTIRSNLLKFTKLFELAVYEDDEKKYQISTSSCPDFLLDELWECLKKYGIKKHKKEKIEPYQWSIVDEDRIILIGRLYIIVLLCYAFDNKNYLDSQKNFTDIVNNSLKKENKQVRALLKAYCELTNRDEDKNIINELFKRSES
ncbi:MAG: hypothetical protein K2J88_04710 [Oscillospiraceae bacterium]|nr:hypothetical protein [Oscillospiraceae bacterium]